MDGKPSNIQLANAVSLWLESNGCTVTIFAKRDHVEVFYTLEKDVTPQPAIIIRDSRISIPRGSQMSVVKAFLNFITRGMD